MSGSDEYNQDGHHHQYEDPRLLARQIRHVGPPPCKSEITVKPRKKSNELYERCRTDSDGSENSARRRGCCRDVMCFLVSLSFVFAVGALALVILVILGHLVTAKCGKCLNEVPPNMPISGAVSNSRSEGMLKMIKELQGNLSALHKVVRHRESVIQQLLEKDDSHSRKLAELAHKPTYVYIRNAKYNISQLRGPPGPRGPTGKQGPPGDDGKSGSGNISTCVYNVKQAKFSPSRSSGHDVFVAQRTVMAFSFVN
ncbi:hypothetical protein QZH41_000156 [Actinostola sp. cb2023]|nr:hypothetical protein QZH41_000156 [Actinostola sp. cb2023]